MKTFFSHLEHLARTRNSLLCVGLDPHPEDLPAPTGGAARDFCLRLIEATHDLAIAYKPNAAFFEALGPDGWRALIEVIQAVPEGLPVLLDAKRGDIASTARAYARAVFDTLGAHAVTINPYLGHDSVAPFLENPENGVFLLCKTSNPGAADLQDLMVTADRRAETASISRPPSSVPPPPIPNPSTSLRASTHPSTTSGLRPPSAQDATPNTQYPIPNYEHLARLAQTWNTHGNLGLVVGATQVDALRRVRAAAPDLWFLAPGVGAQGGDLEAALRAGLRADGLGMLIPVSRGISRAPDPRQAAIDLRDAINRARPSAQDAITQSLSPIPIPYLHPPSFDYERASPALRSGCNTPSPTPHPPLPTALLTLGCVQFGEFTLKSGKQSPIYIDLRRLIADPNALALAAEAFLPILAGLQFDHLAALPYAALPIATAISLRGGWPMIYPRKEAKAYGTKAQIEGVFRPGERAVVIDDLITTGGSKLEGIQKLTAAGLHVSDIVVLIDRSGGVDFMAQHGYRLHAVFTLPELLDDWEAAGRVDGEKIARVRDFLLNVEG